MPFHNPFWAKKQNPVGYLTLGLYPYTAKTTGSQTQAGSSPNTIEITFTNYDENYWNGYEQVIPAYTYFTLGSNALDASNVPAVSNPDTPILPHNMQSVSGANQEMIWQATFASYSASKAYDGSALTAPGLAITDMFAEDKDTVWYSGANPVHLAFSIQKNEGTLTVTAASEPTVTPLSNVTVSRREIQTGRADNPDSYVIVEVSWKNGKAPFTVTWSGTPISTANTDTVNPATITSPRYARFEVTDLYPSGTVTIEDATGATASETLEGYDPGDGE